ncbi:MAG: DNA polymerase III subunit gamma/tau, partial [Clostridia bacterium]|nr:DNA polymerase III subunit gamma/tau [Clostridia bacterium]
DHITSVLKYECQSGKFSHAYLFCGSRGTGKTTCAKILAKAVNCEDIQNGNPCGKCPSCLAIDNGSAIDVLEMDAASNNGVDNIRDIRDEVVYTPSMLKYRVYIVDEVHMLSNSAFNALLKTLEEPPAHVIFILATTEMHKLPSTIISRCQLFDFRRISVPVITARLLKIAEADGIEISPDAAALIARIAQGGMRDAVSLLELCSGSRQRITVDLVNESVGISGRESIMKIAQAVSEKDYETIFSEIATVAASSKDVAVFWQDLLNFYRDMLVTKTARDAAKYLDLTEVEAQETARVAALFQKETLIYHCKLIDRALGDMMKGNCAKRLCAEMTLVRLCDEKLDSSNEALLSRIAALEDKIKTGNFVAAAPAKTESAPLPKAETVEKTGSAPEKATPVTVPSAPEKSPEPTATKAKRNRALPFWAEVVDKICATDPSLIGFLRSSRLYRGEDGKYTLRLDNEFGVQMLSARRNVVEKLAAMISENEGKAVATADIAFDVSNKMEEFDEAEDGIDEILDEVNE